MKPPHFETTFVLKWSCLIICFKIILLSVILNNQLFQILSYPVVLHAKLLQLGLTLCDPMDCSPPGCSVHGIPQAGIREWGVMPFSRESSQPKDWTSISWDSWIAGGVFTAEPLGKLILWSYKHKKEIRLISHWFMYLVFISNCAQVGGAAPLSLDAWLFSNKMIEKKSESPQIHVYLFSNPEHWVTWDNGHSLFYVNNVRIPLCGLPRWSQR